MKQFLFGKHHGDGRPFHLPLSSFDTHWHLIGGTGKGKTTALHTILHALMLDPIELPSIWVIDKLGNLSEEILLWMASEFCPEHARDRLIYIEPSNENIAIPLNPLLYDTLADGYYKVSRAMEIIMRGWEMQNLESAPRLNRWLWNTFWGGAQLGLTIADCAHLVMPGSDYHKQLIRALPPGVSAEWKTILQCHPDEALRLLEAVQNRLKPYIESPILRNFFAGTDSRFNVRRFMREGKIVIVNLGPYNRLRDQDGNAIGGLTLNEILATARSLPPDERNDTYVLLDEFQNFVSKDMEAAIPEVRQLGVKLSFSHQSFSQLKRGHDIDLTSIIFQAQSRMIFGLQGEDADILAHELASLKYDPYRIKQELFTRRQLLTGHKIVELQSRAFTQSEAENWSRNYGQGWSRKENIVHGQDRDVRSDGIDRSDQTSDGKGGNRGSSATTGTSEHLVPIHQTFDELCSRTYWTFEEFMRTYGGHIRKLHKGVAYLRLVDDDEVHHIDVKRDVYGYLAWGWKQLREFYPEAIDDKEKLKERNYQQDYFVSPAIIERETHERLQRILNPPIRVIAEPQRQSKDTPFS